ncbi:HTH-type transcriptional repressor NsrR [Gammaproteobacteria bacterium]|nr:HTH-type transcriptional repressor NsrR [Gammaproteobacteria bacterium]
MRLTTMTDYALRLLMYVAQQDGRLCTIAEVAQAYSISEAHLMKITHQLALAGWLETLRGKGGGMRLARPPEQINLGEVVRSIEPDFSLVECFATGSTCTLTGTCGLTGVLAGAMREFMQYLDRHSLADVVAPPPTERPTVVRFDLTPRPRARAKAA